MKRSIKNMPPLSFPDIGTISDGGGFHRLAQTGDGAFVAGVNGVANVASTGDRKVEFVGFADRTLARVKS